MDESPPPRARSEGTALPRDCLTADESVKSECWSLGGTCYIVAASLAPGSSADQPIVAMWPSRLWQLSCFALCVLKTWLLACS